METIKKKHTDTELLNYLLSFFYMTRNEGEDDLSWAFEDDTKLSEIHDFDNDIRLELVKRMEAI